MTRKMKWVALGIVGGVPAAALIVGAVVAAIDGDWTGVQVIGGVLWTVAVAKMALELAWQDETPTDGKPDSAGKE
jgi:hypothetical protein